MDETALHELGVSSPLQEHVLRLATMTQDCGLDGVVCSAQEAPLLRKAAGEDFILVTPGIRLKTDSKNDQARTVTPPEAVRLGANYLVIGRPITQSPDPGATLAAIRESLGEGAAA
ncbi:MAG: orotidine 5'-phosphate decarboxylase / HUMPS family protein, partial [Usitatibacter sp.]